MKIRARRSPAAAQIGVSPQAAGQYFTDILQDTDRILDAVDLLLQHRRHLPA